MRSERWHRRSSASKAGSSPYCHPRRWTPARSCGPARQDAMRETPVSPATDVLDPALRAAFLRLIDQRFGLRATDHLARALDEAVAALAADAECASPQALYEAFAAGSRWDLLEALVGQLTVGETHFFRVAPQIEALQRVVLPELIQRRAAQRRLSIWSAGCSTGEEPYTLAILVREQLPAARGWDIQILATDVSHPALQAARHATYGEWSFRDTPSRVRTQDFTPVGKRWRLSDSIRRMVRFAHLNLAADVFPSPAPTGPTRDPIVCRNVTIYFSADATRRLYARFADALVPEGWLVLGPSDPAPDNCPGLDAVHLPGVMLWRRRVSAGSAVDIAPRPRGGA